MGGRKTVNGAYRYRYAPFLMSTYYVMGRSPLALPLGELSPQVTERFLQPFSNDKINLCTHITEIPVVRGVSSPCEAVGHFLIGCCLLAWSLFSLSVLATLGHLSQGERQDVFPGTSPLRALAALGHLSQRERQDAITAPADITAGAETVLRTPVYFPGRSVLCAVSPAASCARRSARPRYPPACR